MIATPEGIHKARTVKRVPLQRRWSVANLKEVKWAPWHRYRGANSADGDIPEGVEEEEEPEEKTGDEGSPVGKEKVRYSS